MDRLFDVVVVGELNVDLIMNQIEKTPEVGKEVIASQMTLGLGSSSAIFSSNLSTLGSTVAFAGKLGKDNFGDYVISALESRGVCVDHILRSDNHNTGITTVLNFNEDRAMITYPGAMRDLTIDDISDEILKKSSHLHVSSLFLQTGLLKDVKLLFSKAKSFGLTTSFDPQWDPSEKWDIDLKSFLPYVDVFMPNAEEVKWLASESDFDNAVSVMRSMSNVLVVKNGRKGAHLWSKDAGLFQPAFVNENVADSIGAGDSFNAGFIHKFLQQRPLRECLEFGALMGAINTTQPGGTMAFENIGKVKNIAKTSFNYIF